MTHPELATGPARKDRAYGPAVGEPPPWVDPRRWGSLIGVAGGIAFIGYYSPAVGAAIAAVAWIIGVPLALAALFWHYVRPVALGHLDRPRPIAVTG